MKKMAIAILMIILAMTVTSQGAYFTGATNTTQTITNAPNTQPVTNITNGTGFVSADNWNGTHGTSATTQWYCIRDLASASHAGRGPIGTWFRIQLARTTENPDRTVQTLRQIKIWNMNSTNAAVNLIGLETIRITSFDIGTNTWTDLGTYTIPKGTGNTTTDYGYICDIPDIAYPYYIQITNISYDNVPAIDDSRFGWLGCAEVRFDGDIINAWAEAADQNVTLAAGQAGIALNGAIHGAQATGAVWTQLSGPGTVVFTNNTDPATTATFPVAGSYVLALTENASGYADHVAVRVGDAADGYSGLIGYWPLDGSANDASGNGKNGTVSGSPSYVAGKVGQAMAFDGIDDGVEIPDEPYFDRVVQISPDMTVTFWAQLPYGVAPQGHAISKLLWDISNIRGAGWAMIGIPEKFGGNLLGFVGTRDSNVSFKYAGVGIYNAPNDGKWHHFAFKTTSAGTASFYLDGVQRGSTGTFDTSSKSISNDEPITFGYADSYQTGYRWEGLLDEVRIYDKALSQPEIEAEFLADGGTRCTAVLAGDVNNDCQVDLADLDLLLDTWLECTNYFPGDCF